MSFILKSKGKMYEPGYFLTNDENCVRETRQFSQANGVTGENGGKYVPMGTAYPTNDNKAIGIVYEDVDVTMGDMPGSVVTKGEVIEDRLAVTNVTYATVTPEGTENPTQEHWYEKNGDSYEQSTDVAVDSDKTYYEVDEVTRLSADAKTALEALGFKFKAESNVTRPNFR